MPYKINDASEHYGWDYLSGVTELGSLRTLVLDNSFDDTNLIEPKVFERASNLCHLSVHNFSPDKQALIMLLGLRESLTSFEIKNYFQTTRNPLDVDDQEERTTYPLREFGPNWKKFRLGGYAGLVPTELLISYLRRRQDAPAGRVIDLGHKNLSSISQRPCPACHA